MIFFREKEDLRFFFIEVGVDVRSKLKMQAQMFTLGANGAPRPLKKTADLLQLADALAARQSEAETYEGMIQKTQNKAGLVKVFPKLKDAGDFKTILDSASKAAKLANRQYKACGEYAEIIQNLNGLSIPFLIFFDIDGHRIKLAESTAQ